MWQLAFAAAGRPAADLRLNEGTCYRFECVACGQPIDMGLGWVVTGVPDPGIIRGSSPSRDAEGVFGLADGHFRELRCSECRARYLVASIIDETSLGAYRAQVVAMAWLDRD